MMKYVIRIRTDRGWQPAVTGTLNETGQDDENASSFDTLERAEMALAFVRAEYGDTRQLMICVES